MKRILSISLFLALLVSCDKPSPFGRSESIRLNVYADDTKGTVTTTDGLKASGAFSMAAFISDDYVKRDENSDLIMDGEQPKLFPGGPYFSGDGNVTLNSGKWGISGNPVWISDVSTHFWSWHPVTVAGRSAPTPVLGTAEPEGEKYPYTGELTFSYTIASTDGTTDADNAKDLLFAYSKKFYKDKKNPAASDLTIDITFHHALSQVRFCVSTDDGTFDKSLKIKHISISNLASTGKSVFNGSGFVWSDRSTPLTFGQNYNGDFSTSAVSGWTKGSYTKEEVTYNLYTCDNVFFLIPQTVSRQSTPAASNMLTVTFEYNGTPTVVSVPITGESSEVGDYTEWLGDHYYTYKINATTVGRDIDFSVSLVGWSNRKEEIII